MNSVTVAASPLQLSLAASFASDLMTPNPVSIRDVATLKEAVAMLTDKGFSAAPVIDHAGRPVGVLSRSDILIHEREKVEYLQEEPEFFRRSELHTSDGEQLRGFQVERNDQTKVSELMTPVVFSVEPDTPAAKVISEMLSLNIHRLFVVDGDGVLIGVVSALDVLRHLQ